MFNHYPRLQKKAQRRSREQSKGSDDYDALLEDAKGIPFWLEGDPEKHEQLRREHKLDRGNSNCCFWDLLGRPVKHQPNPLFDYQQIILNALEFFYKIRIKKFRGAGMTEQLLRYPAWLALNSNQFKHKKAFFITGITQELANDEILRLKNVFLEYYPGSIEAMNYTQKTLTLNDCLFRAYPAKNPDAPRGKTDVFYILADEFDFHNRRIQEDVMSVVTPFRPKNDTLIILNSTTKRTNGLYKEMDDEWNEFLETLNLKGKVNQYDLLKPREELPNYFHQIKENDKHRYFLLEFDYLWGLGKIYTEAEIEEVKEDRTFPGEFCLKYAGQIGNYFPAHHIDLALELGEQYKGDPINQFAGHWGGIDPESKAVFYVIEVEKDKIVRIVDGAEYPREITPHDFATQIHKVSSKYKFIRWFIDGNHRGYVNEIKQAFGEDDDWMKAEDVNWEDNKIIPVNFSREHKEMLFHTRNCLSKGYLAIPRKYDKLEIALRTAWAEGNSLDKDESDNTDHLDALRLSLKGVEVD
jgi:hypothetical protein